MSDKNAINLMKFTLTGGKVIHLREPKISDTETAAQTAGKGASSDNQIHMGMLLQKELFKILLVKVDNKAVTLNEKQLLDKLFTYKEYQQCMKAVKMVLGEDEGNASEQLVPEFENSGEA